MAVRMVDLEELDMKPLMAISKDLREAAKNLRQDEVRFLVDTYYAIQKNRVAAGNQVKALSINGEPNEFVNWLSKQMHGLEKRVKAVLDVYTEQYPLGRWCKSIRGIGPVLTAALMAYINIEKAPTAGHIWRYAGLDPTTKWLGSEEAARIVQQILGKTTGEITDADIIAVATTVKRSYDGLIALWPTDKDGALKPKTATNLIAALSKRPWNARLKVVCWKIGESFVKVKSYPDDVYGKIYEQRKQYETEKNERGEYAQQAAEHLKRVGKNTASYQWYKQGKLPPGHIHERAKRYAVKLFLSHYHYVAYRLHYNEEPPKPYAIAHLGHADFILPPNLHIVF